ncbi:MAG: hypothetical protein Q7S53_00530 [bacterium]|nr:hypothetical protein [bacterium]
MLSNETGKKGIFAVESNDFYSATAESIPLWKMPDIKEGVSLKVPRIPYSRFNEIVEQMRYVAKNQNAELYIAMYYSHDEQEYRFVIPDQTAVGVFVIHSDLPPSPPGYNQIGDLHSHVDEPAGHSQFDDQDELGMPGIHITIGNLLTSVFPSISCSVIVGDKRVFFYPEDIFEPPPALEEVELEELTSVKIPQVHKSRGFRVLMRFYLSRIWRYLKGGENA